MSKRAANGVSDYGQLGIDIQTAMLRHVKAHPNRAERTKYIVWNGQRVWTSYEVIAPPEGRFVVRFVSTPTRPPQGVDIKPDRGEVILPAGDRVQTLRTWHEEGLENVVEYHYRSAVGALYLWNVFRRHWPDGRVTEEKWTGNAGFIVDDRGDGLLLFRCSDGLTESPDFSRLVFEFSVIKE